jgi:hypothetical protein
VEVVTMGVEDHMLVRRFDLALREIANQPVSVAWLVQTQRDVVALLEQNAHLHEVNERAERSFSVTFTDKSAALAAIEAAFAE